MKEADVDASTFEKIAGLALEARHMVLHVADLQARQQVLVSQPAVDDHDEMRRRDFEAQQIIADLAALHVAIDGQRAALVELASTLTG